MNEIPGTSTDFECETDETVTIDIQPKNAAYAAVPEPAPDVTVNGQQITVEVGNSSKRVTIGFGFSNPSGGGSYDLEFNGNKGHLRFFRNISQEGSDPVAVTCRFRV